MNKTFLINRLKQMSIPEIVFRLRNEVNKAVEKNNYRKVKFSTDKLGEEGILLLQNISIEDKSELIKLAEEICCNKLDIFSLKHFYIGEKINYHKDYKSNKTSPEDNFGKDIDYRDSAKIGDIKYIWEPNRQLFILILALANYLTDDDKYINKLQEYLMEWLVQNPFMLGVNWCSPLELAIRLINWALSWKLVGHKLDESIKKEMLDSVYKHCWYIDRNYSKYSSANNHLIGEAAGVFIAAVLFPKVDESEKWIKKAKAILEREGELQNYSDGVNKEQAISYEQFVFDFLFLSGLIGGNNGLFFSDKYWNILDNMGNYIKSITNINYELPHYGDEDDGFVIDLNQKHYGVYKSIVNTTALFFHKRELLSYDWTKDIKTNFYLAIMGKKEDEIDKCISIQTNDKFEKGGYFILCNERGTINEQLLVFDCGNLGYISLAAHGHADALSFWFSAWGVPIFIDTGTYAYHTNKEWRDYFRGTSAHNTVRVDGMDQSTICGNFMWTYKAKAYLTEYVKDKSVSGYHDGYEKLPGKVKHERKIEFIKEDDYWQITDDITGKDYHTAELFFHLNHKCSAIKTAKDTIKIGFSHGNILLTVKGGDKMEIFQGEMSPILGWYSSSYDVKAVTKTIVVTKSFKDKITIQTKFKVSNLT